MTLTKSVLFEYREGLDLTAGLPAVKKFRSAENRQNQEVKMGSVIKGKTTDRNKYIGALRDVQALLEEVQVESIISIRITLFDPNKTVNIHLSSEQFNKYFENKYECHETFYTTSNSAYLECFPSPGIYVFTCIEGYHEEANKLWKQRKSDVRCP